MTLENRHGNERNAELISELRALTQLNGKSLCTKINSTNTKNLTTQKKLNHTKKINQKMSQGFGSVSDRAVDDKTAKELAKAVYTGLRSEGCLAGDMISVSSLLISLITADIRHSDQ